jgi:hypothetical protein
VSDRREIGEYGAGVGEQVDAGEGLRKIGERPAYVRGDQVEARRRGGREKPNVEILVEE